MDGRLRLGELLGWAMEDFDEDAQMRESILLDFLYGSLMFGVQKGVPWSQVPALVQVASQFHQGTIGNYYSPSSSSSVLSTDLFTEYYRTILGVCAGGPLHGVSPYSYTNSAVGS